MKFLNEYYNDKKTHDDEIFLYVTYPKIKDKWYVISNYGQIIKFANNKNMKTHTDKDGYFRLSLSAFDNNGNNIFCHVGVHRLVAWEFCKKPKGCEVVNHLDANNQNNHAENLEWTTVKGNTQHAIANGLTVRSGCNSNGARYDQRIIEDICQKLESGMDVYQVYETYYPYDTSEDHHSFYMLIYRLKTNEKYLYPVRSKYNIDTKNISSQRKDWSKEELKELKKMIKSGMSNKEIFKAYGFDKTYMKGASRIADKLHDVREELGILNPDVVKLDKKKKEIKEMIKDGQDNEYIYKFYGVENLKSDDKKRQEITHLINKIRHKLGIYDSEYIRLKDRRQTTIELIKSGKTNVEIYEFYGVENFSQSDSRRYAIRNQVVDLRKQLGIPDPDKVKHNDTKKEMESFINSGKNDKEIYKFYGVENLKDTDTQKRKVRSLIYNTRKQLNIPDPEKVEKQKERDCVLEMIKSCKTNREIYEFYGVENLNVEKDKDKIHIKALIDFYRKQLNISNPR